MATFSTFWPVEERTFVSLNCLVAGQKLLKQPSHIQTSQEISEMITLAVYPLYAKGVFVYEIRNAEGKLVCRVDILHATIEIIRKRYKTIIIFNSDKTISITNSKPA